MENYQNQNEPFNNLNQGFNNGNPNFMPVKLPNATVSLVLGIFSIICCCSTVGGLIFAIIGLILANKDLKTYQANPQQYMGVETVNTARILNIIGIVLSILNLVYSIYYIMQLGGWDAYMQQIQDAINMAQQNR